MRLFLITLVCLFPLCAQQDGQQKKKGGPPPGPPTNLKVLKVTSGQEVRQIMSTFTTGLGVRCNYCHEQNNYAADTNPKKETARHMIQMTEQINGNFKDGKMHVTCYTCHRGEEEPKTAPEPKPAF